RRDQTWRRPAGDQRGRDHHVELRQTGLELLLLLTLLLLGQRGRVTALRLLADDAEVEPAGAEALYLLPHDGSHVEAGDDRTEAASGRDGLKPGDACTEHEHLRGRDRPGRGHQHRE